MDKYVKKVFGINLFYLLSGIALLTLGSYFQKRNLIIGLLQTEWILIFLPVVFYMVIKKVNLKEIKINPISLKDSTWVIIATLLFYPIALFLNTSFNFLIGFFIGYPGQSVPLPQSLTEYLIYIPVISLSAGICEELLFRGVMMAEYKKLGKQKSIVIAAVLFGIFHFNLQNLIGPIALGILFGYMVYKTDSLFAGIIGHAVNNLIALTLGYLAVLSSPEISEEIPMEIEPIQLLIPLIFWGMFAFVCLQILKRVIDKIGNPITEPDNPEILLQAIKKFEWIPIFLMVVIYSGLMFMVYKP